VCPQPGAASTIDFADRLRAILESKNLTLHQVSQQSEVQYGRSSPYFLPHNLYYDLRRGRFSPSIYQLSVLSRVSNYLLNDWLRAFGFNVEDIPRLQVVMPSNRTVLLNSSLDDPQAWVPWLENTLRDTPTSPLAPLVELVESTDRRRLDSISGPDNRDFVYAKVGRGDALAFPDLLPGSIVRADRTVGNNLMLRRNGTTSDRIFLIEHSKGLSCCRLRIVGDSLIVPVSTLPYAQIELRLPQEARVIGVADFEIRPLVKTAETEVPKELAKHWMPGTLTEENGLGHLLRHSRTKMDMSLRDASLMSHQIVVLLGDERYFVSPSSLSDYEVLDTPPRHFHKAITLCALYGLQFYSFLKTIGIEPDKLGKEPMPDHLVGRPSVEEDSLRVDEEPQRGGFLGEFLRECGEVPFFLRSSLETLSGLSDVSLDDCFWVGREPNPLNPYLAHALLVVVNRRKRRPVYFRSKSLWEQPLYVVLKRDGTYLCACCGIENGSLVVHPHSQQLYRPTQLRYHDDAEVVGQVVTIASSQIQVIPMHPIR
jgi:hypothetical protein